MLFMYMVLSVLDISCNITCKNRVYFWLNIGLSYEDLQIHRHFLSCL